MEKRFVRYTGTVSAFKAATNDSGTLLSTQYNDSIVFIGSGEAIYSKGQYFGNLGSLSYIKSVKKDGASTEYTAVGGGTLIFKESTPATVSVDVTSGGITIGLTSDFVTTVNNKADSSTVSALSTTVNTISSGYVKSISFAGKALTVSSNAASISQADARTALGLGNAAYTTTTAITNNIVGSSSDTASSETIYGTRAYAKGLVDALDIPTQSEIETIAANKINALIDAVDSEDTIENINNLVTYVNDNAADIAALTTTANTASTNASSALNKIAALDLASTGGSGKYITTISQTDGKVTATAASLATTVSLTNTNPVTSAAVAQAISDLDTGVMTASVTQKLTSGTEIGTVTIDGTATKLYAPTSATSATNATNVGITGSSTAAAYPLVFTSAAVTSTTAATNQKLYTDTDNKITYNPSTNTLTCTTFSGNATSATTATTATKLGNTTVGGATKPIYLNAGTATACSTYAGGTAVTLNGSSKAASTASFYAPTTVGTSGQILTSAGSGAPTWSTSINANKVIVSDTPFEDHTVSEALVELYQMWTWEEL